MKKENIFKKVLMCIGYISITFILVSSIFILIQKSSSNENGNIVQAQDSDTYFRNTNPKFTVDFVNSEYIRFETVRSYKNPFVDNEGNLWEKIKYILGIGKSTKGLQLSLEEISYDPEISELLPEGFEEKTLQRDFELIQSGREIGGGESEAITKDTIVSRGVYRGVNIEYQILEGKGLKEEIVLDSLPEYQSDCNGEKCMLPANRFVFKITLDKGLELRKSITSIPGFPSGTQYITDSEGNYFAHFLPEFAIDAVGNKTSDIHINVSQTEVKNEYIYELIVGSKWLLSSERVFPIRIDPSIVHDSELSFDMGIYERTILDQTSTIRLNDYLSGEYISEILPLGDSVTLEGISSTTFGLGTGSVELAYSNLGILLEENFNDLTSDIYRSGDGAYQLQGDSNVKVFNIPSQQSPYFTVELWAYSRYRSQVTQELILNTNIGDILISGGKYALRDNSGSTHESQIEANYNVWTHLAVVFDINNSAVNIYIDGKDEIINFNYDTNNVLTSLSIGGEGGMYGYLDTLRVYDRLLTRYEILSNTQYANTYLEYRDSSDGSNWSQWKNDSSFEPVYVQAENNINVSSVTNEDFSKYDLISFLYARDTQSELYLGSSQFSNGSEDNESKILTEQTGLVDNMSPIEYLDMWFTPNTLQQSCIFSIEDLNISTLVDGKVVLKNSNGELLSTDSYILNKQNHIAVKKIDENIYLYVNGNLSNTETLSGPIQPGNYTIGCSDIDGDITNVRISSNSTIDVNEAASLKDRMYEYSPVFSANLQSTNGVPTKETKQISIREAESTSNYIENIYIGELIILEEKINDINYFVEGEVISLNKSTGTLEVKEWVGEFPEQGFSQNVNIYKWQREYIPIHNYFDTSKPLNTLSISSTMGKIKDIKLISGTTQIFDAFSSGYIQYKYIFVSKILGLTPYLSSVNINYSVAGPSMEQIMRHGNWFNDGQQQSYWWAN